MRLFRPGSKFILVNSTTSVYPSNGTGGSQAGVAGSDLEGAKLVLIERVFTDNRTSVDGAVVIEDPGGTADDSAYAILTATGHKNPREVFKRFPGPFTARVLATTQYAVIVYRDLTDE